MEGPPVQSPSAPFSFSLPLGHMLQSLFWQQGSEVTASTKEVALSKRTPPCLGHLSFLSPPPLKPM